MNRAGAIVALLVVGLVAAGVASAAQGNLAVDRDPGSSTPGKRDTMLGTLSNEHPVETYAIAWVEEEVPDGFTVDVDTVRPDPTAVSFTPDGATRLRWDVTGLELGPAESWSFSYVFTAPHQTGAYVLKLTVDYEDALATHYRDIIQTSFPVAEPVPSFAGFGLVMGALAALGVVAVRGRSQA